MPDDTSPAPTPVAASTVWHFSGHIEIRASNGASTHLKTGDIVSARDTAGVDRLAAVAKGNLPLIYLTQPERPV
ncbi:hypothetical protein ACNUDN_25255 [Mycobacterium sp. smrl_JER01]|uniref:hypothetical protein n=1 Tax=Mycobacterium sp. smrl_JER01 TaxID=3402633 RepID=UPI003ACBBCF2